MVVRPYNVARAIPPRNDLLRVRARVGVVDVDGAVVARGSQQVIRAVEVYGVNGTVVFLQRCR